MEGAPRAGAWFDEYVQMLVENANPELFGESPEVPQEEAPEEEAPEEDGGEE